MLTAGIDAGSRTLKIVLLEADEADGANSEFSIIRGLRDQGIRPEETAESLLRELLEKHGIARGNVGRIVATGYGRAAIRCADAAITEITCHARGVRHLHPETRMIIDIGGQDSKVIWLAPGGLNGAGGTGGAGGGGLGGVVQDFAMNDRCAAGTGRFLEIVAARLGAPVERLGNLAARARQTAPINSTCAVFAETEIVGLLSAGEPPENIVAGVQKAIAARVAALAGCRIQEPVYLTGGVALISGMAAALAEALGGGGERAAALRVADSPQFTGALGAALLAAETVGD